MNQLNKILIFVFILAFFSGSTEAFDFEEAQPEDNPKMSEEVLEHLQKKQENICCTLYEAYLASSTEYEENRHEFNLILGCTYFEELREYMAIYDLSLFDLLGEIVVGAQASSSLLKSAKDAGYKALDNVCFAEL